MSELNLTNHFLIAMPAMTDPFFAKSLTYVCEHNDQGAMGIVVNRPISLTLSELFAQINMPLKPTELEDVLVHFGGPVQTDRGFVLHDAGAIKRVRFGFEMFFRIKPPSSIQLSYPL